MSRTPVLASALVLAAVCIVAVVVWAFPAHLDTTYGCKSEDMVEVKIIRDSYDWMHGEHACVHIENLEDGQ